LRGGLGNANLKTMKIHFEDGSSEGITWDFATWRHSCTSCETYRSLPEGDCDTDKLSTHWGRRFLHCWDIYDGGWHYYIWHIDSPNNIHQLWVDGVEVIDEGTTPDLFPDGFNTQYGISFGGNMGGGFI